LEKNVFRTECEEDVKFCASTSVKVQNDFTGNYILSVIHFCPVFFKGKTHFTGLKYLNRICLVSFENVLYRQKLYRICINNSISSFYMRITEKLSKHIDRNELVVFRNHFKKTQNTFKGIIYPHCPHFDFSYINSYINSVLVYIFDVLLMLYRSYQLYQLYKLYKLYKSCLLRDHSCSVYSILKKMTNTYLLKTSLKTSYQKIRYYMLLSEKNYLLQSSMSNKDNLKFNLSHIPFMLELTFFVISLPSSNRLKLIALKTLFVALSSNNIRILFETKSFFFLISFQCSTRWRRHTSGCRWRCRGGRQLVQPTHGRNCRNCRGRLHEVPSH
jgi:hypothetical protein